MSKKKPLLLFSGGLDSTYLLLTTLWDKECDVVTLSSNSLHDEQQKAEALAREAILSEFNRLRMEIKQLRSVRHTYNMRMDFTSAPHAGLDFQQVPFWFFVMAEHVDSNIHSSVGIGYAMGDQIAHRTDHLKKAWKHFWKACKRGPLVPLSFPLLECHVDKTQIVSYFENNNAYYDKLLALTHYCENPKLIDGVYRICNDCPSCLRMRPFNVHQRKLVWLDSPSEKTISILEDKGDSFSNKALNYC